MEGSSERREAITHPAFPIAHLSTGATRSPTNQPGDGTRNVPMVTCIPRRTAFDVSVIGPLVAIAPIQAIILWSPPKIGR